MKIWAISNQEAPLLLILVPVVIGNGQASHWIILNWSLRVKCDVFHKYSFLQVFYIVWYFNALATQLKFVFPGPPDVVSAIRGGCIVIPFFFCILNPKQITDLGVEWFLFSEFFLYFKYFSLFLWISYFAELGLRKPHISGTSSSGWNRSPANR